MGLFLGVSVYGGYLALKTDLPPIFSFQDYVDSSLKMSRLYAADGTVIGVFYRERRTVVPLDSVAPHLEAAILSAEDGDFYTHEGLDFFSIARALLRDIVAGKYVQGGSTITQQVAKTFYLSSEKTLSRKAKEAVLAFALEQKLTKRDILALYLNQIYFGHGRYGVAEACRYYFSKGPGEVSVAEAATLAGLIRSPERLSPFKYPDKILPIRNHVLAAMLKRKAIALKEYEEALEEILPARRPPSEEPAWAKYYVDAVRRILLDSFALSELYTGGFRIYTAMDAREQKQSATGLQTELQKYEKKLGRIEGAFVRQEWKTGRVRALIGGRDFGQSSFNRAVQSRRSIGSVVKPFVFAFALSTGKVTGDDTFTNKRLKFPDGKGGVWSPRNFTGTYDDEEWTLKDALASSVNTVAVQVLKTAGVKEFARFWTQITEGEKVQGTLSLALGSMGLSPLRLAGLFSLFPSGGVVRDAVLVDRVLEPSGRNMWKVKPRTRRVMDRGPVALLRPMLESVVLEGSGRNAAIEGARVFGKTGTSNGAVDSWFAGFTGDTVAVVWLGRDNNTPVEGGGGGRLAAPLWKKLMSEKGP